MEELKIRLKNKTNPVDVHRVGITEIEGNNQKCNAKFPKISMKVLTGYKPMMSTPILVMVWHGFVH